MLRFIIVKTSKSSFYLRRCHHTFSTLMIVESIIFHLIFNSVRLPFQKSAGLLETCPLLSKKVVFLFRYDPFPRANRHHSGLGKYPKVRRSTFPLPVPAILRVLFLPFILIISVKLTNTSHKMLI
jgi:hypothetical protein